MTPNHGSERSTPPATHPTTDADSLLFSDEEDGRERVLLVDVGDKVHALPVLQVREVVRAGVVTRVPGATRVVRGLINVRGMVVTVLDLMACLDLAPPIAMARQPDGEPSSDGQGVSRAESAASIVLLEHGGRLAGLAVDAVRDVRPLDDAALIAGWDVTAQANGNPVVRGLASAGGDVVILLDAVALLARHLISTEEMGR